MRDDFAGLGSDSVNHLDFEFQFLTGRFEWDCIFFEFPSWGIFFLGVSELWAMLRLLGQLFVRLIVEVAFSSPTFVPQRRHLVLRIHSYQFF
jgi:hypothetical protein